jgi:Asp/Glu/hydantoin racemase
MNLERTAAENTVSQHPIIGILAWEGRPGQLLSQLEAIPGNILNNRTFSFPVCYQRVPGANFHTVIERPSEKLLQSTIECARILESKGVQAITTSCGFNAIFQRDLSESTSVPVFTSSLLQVPLVHQMLSSRRYIGIITADARYLTQEHLENCAIAPTTPLHIVGIEKTGEFRKIRLDPHAKLDPARFISEIVEVSLNLVKEKPNLGAFVLECTDLPPASQAIRDATGLPVFDIVTLTNYVCAWLGAKCKWPCLL